MKKYGRGAGEQHARLQLSWAPGFLTLYDNRRRATSKADKEPHPPRDDRITSLTWKRKHRWLHGCVGMRPCSGGWGRCRS